jgi:hypothetical protein
MGLLLGAEINSLTASRLGLSVEPKPRPSFNESLARFRK